MAEQDLYQIAERRIDERNRRWKLWAVNLAALVLTLSLLIMMEDTVYEGPAAALFMAWAGFFTFHTVTLLMAQSREGDIEKEVAKLRTAYYEKPKRLEVGDDGELVERDEWAVDEEEKRLRM